MSEKFDSKIGKTKLGSRMKGLLELVTRVNCGKAADRPFSKLHSHSVSHSVIHQSKRQHE